jgi:hypothetical protein
MLQQVFKGTAENLIDLTTRRASFHASSWKPLRRFFPGTSLGCRQLGHGSCAALEVPLGSRFCVPAASAAPAGVLGAVCAHSDLLAGEGSHSVEGLRGVAPSDSVAGGRGASLVVSLGFLLVSLLCAVQGVSVECTPGASAPPPPPPPEVAPGGMDVEEGDEGWRKFRSDSADDGVTRITWSINGIPVKERNPAVTPAAIRTAFEASMRVPLAGPVGMMVPRGLGAQVTFAFGTTVGVRAGAFRATVAEGFRVPLAAPVEGGDKDVLLSVHERQPAPDSARFHSAALKIHRAGELDLEVLKEWVPQVMGTPMGEEFSRFQVQLMPFKGKDDAGKETLPVYGVYMESLDMLQRFSWRTTFVPEWKGVKLLDRAGNEVTSYRVALPYMGRTQADEYEWQLRRVHMAGMGECRNEELSRHLCESSPLFDDHGAEVWVSRDRLQGASRGFGFGQMLSKDVVPMVVQGNHTTVGGERIRVEAAKPKVAPVQHQQQFGEDRGGSGSSDLGKRAWPGLGAGQGSLSVDMLQGAMRGVLEMYPHLVDPAEMQKVSQQALVAERPMLEQIAYQQSVEANRPLLDLLTSAERSVERVADVLAAHMGIQVGTGPKGKRKAFDHPEVRREVSGVVQRAGLVAAGLPPGVPGPLRDGASPEESAGWLAQMQTTQYGSQVLASQLAQMTGTSQAAY